MLYVLSMPFLGASSNFKENMDKIRRWVRNAGFEVVEARNEAGWDAAAVRTQQFQNPRWFQKPCR
jgi:hypothetical protein